MLTPGGASSPYKKEVSAPLVLFLFFLLFVFVFLTADLGETLAKRGLGEEIGRQAGVVLADAEEHLAGAASVAVGGDLHGGTHAVHQLKIGEDVGLDVAAVHGFVGSADDGANQQTRRTVDR